MHTPNSSASPSAGSGPLLVILAGICWGIVSLFIRGLNSLGIRALEVVFLRSWFSAFLLLIYFLLTRPSLLRVSPKDLWMFFGTGVISMTFFTYCYFTSILESGAAVAVVLLYTSPIFVMLMSALVFRERITSRKLLSLAMTFCGCVLVAGLAGGGTRLTPGALLLGLGAGFGYALYSIFAGLAVRKYSSLTITFYTLLFCGISLLFLLNPCTLPAKLFQAPVKSLLSLAGISLLCTVVPYLSYTAGLARMEAGRAAVLVTVEPLVGSLLGILAYREPLSVMKLLGILLIFTAVLLLSKK